MTMSEDPYKSYSLSNLEEWMSDVLDSDSSPDEIYESIVDTVKKNMRFHKACYDSSVRLLGLLKGNTNLAVHDGITTETMDGITIGPIAEAHGITEDGSTTIHELSTDYYNASMFDLTSPNLDDITIKD